MKTTVAGVLLSAGLCCVTWAGEWHVDSTLTCQNCHLQHSSQQGQSVPGGPYTYLLLKSTINELCLSCHDGSDPTAPDVQDPVQMYEGTSSGESSAGFFGLVGADNPLGHNLGIGATTPLQAEGRFVILDCAHCHAVHGNGNYRNLLYDPAGLGDSMTLVDGDDLFTQVSPDKPPTIAGSVAAYNRDNIGYKQGYAAWCTSCHDKLTVNSGALLPAHFNDHPSDIALNAFPSEPHTDAQHWVGGIGEGFLDVGDTSSVGIRRVPFEAPLSTDYISARQTAVSNEVFCGSCHKAHGGHNQKGLRWPYIAGGANFISGCQQCHNK